MTLKKLKIMTTLQMKVELFELVAQAKDKNVVARLYEKMQEFMDEEGDGWNDLSPEEQSKLDAAIAETYDPSKIIAHQDALNMINRCLTK